jgi:hypothetical protein
MLEIANVWALILMKQDDDDIDREISNDEHEDSGESTMSSDIEEDDLDIRQDVLHLDQAHHDKTIQTTRVPLRKKRSCADTVIARAPLPNLRHPARATTPLLFKRQKSVINISCESDLVEALPLPNVRGDQNVPQPKAGGDHNIPQHQKATLQVATKFMEAIVFPKTPWQIISNEKYSMVDEASKLAIEAQDLLRAFAGVAVGTPSVCPLPGGPALKIEPQTQHAVSVCSVFCSSIRVMMVLDLETYTGKTEDWYLC